MKDNKIKFTKKFNSLLDLKDLWKPDNMVKRDKTKFLTDIKSEKKLDGTTK